MALGYDDALQAVKLIEKSGSVANLVGIAGIGKTALVQDLARQENAKLFTTVVSLSEKGDLAIPVPPLTSDSFIQTQKYGKLADVQFGYSHTLIQIIEHAERYPDEKIIWFLDEFNRGTVEVQSELMNLVLQRQINSLKLPEQVSIIIAENPDSSMDDFADSNYAVYDSDDAITDRTVRINMKVDVDSWIKWANENDCSAQVVDFIKNNPDYLYKGPDDIKPTPRAWERVSKFLNSITNLEDVNDQVLLEVISGNIGRTIATGFLNDLRKPDNKITIQDLTNDDLSVVLQKLHDVDEATKLDVISEFIDNVDDHVSDETANRIYQYVESLSEDGKYAAASHLINKTHIATSLYSKYESSDEQKKLYDKLVELAFKNYR